ncbi:MAG: CoA-binding protein [Candidatus Lokiarchaeota archaeon]
MTHFLEGFLNPRSIAFYGANNKGAGIGAFQFMGLINSGFKGKLYPIHLKLGSVMGYKAYKSISEVPEVPDLVVIVLPPKIVPKIFKECGQKGIKRLIVISGGFREMTGVKENNLTEELKRGKKFLELAKRIVPNKPIIAISVGESQAAKRAVKSHTGSLAGNSKIYDAAFKEVGIMKTELVEEFLDVEI